jgi:predicted class III extradiol MEMO1 family dioxygenase
MQLKLNKNPLLYNTILDFSPHQEHPSPFIVSFDFIHWATDSDKRQKQTQQHKLNEDGQPTNKIRDKIKNGMIGDTTYCSMPMEKRPTDNLKYE